ncbi:MAG: serine/threonine-protein kinase [Polyangiaceae bacterium]
MSDMDGAGQLGAGDMLNDTLQLERELGKGGMGSVWVARNLALGNEVAVKILKTFADENADDLRARFEQEAKGLARLDHPHLVKIFDYGLTPDGEPFIVMELLRGEDLAQLIRRSGPVEPKKLATIVTQVCKALSKAHAAGVVHRDIKPANLFLLDDEDVFAKVLDFGIARFSSMQLDMTRTGVVMGTPYYMSPEQFSDPRTIDHRSDLWSLGVVIYQALTGEIPFKGETATAVAMATATSKPKPPTALRADLPHGVDEFIARVLSPDREARFSSARELSEAFATAASASAERERLVTSETLPVSVLAETQSVPSKTAPGAGVDTRSLRDGTALAPTDGAAGEMTETSSGAAVPVRSPAERDSSPESEPPRRAPPASARLPWVVAGVLAMGLAVVGGAYIGPLTRGNSLADVAPEGTTAGPPTAAATSVSTATPSVNNSAMTNTPPPLLASSASAQATSSAPSTKTRTSDPGGGPQPTTSTTTTTAVASVDKPDKKVTGRASQVRQTILGCWADNDGSAAGTPKSSVTVSVSVNDQGVPGNPKVAGPASQYKGFTSCTVSRVYYHQYAVGDAETVTVTVTLPASIQ